MPIQTAADSISNSQGSPFGFKNRIINGAMVIDQRNAGASITPTTLYSTYGLDRWTTVYGTASKFSVQQVSTAPAEFTYSQKITSAGAYSVPAGEIYTLNQYVEGYNIADLAWGTSSAKTVILSFWVYSSLTGTFGGAINNGDTNNRAYPFSYTISAANTWERKTITIPGDTTGTWTTTNASALTLRFGLGVGSTYSGTANTWQAGVYYAPTGSTNILGTSGATWYVTGVQLEKGSQATAFDYRDYGTELQLCQRYYEKSYDYSIVPGSSGNLQNGSVGLGIYTNNPAAYNRFGMVYFQTRKRTGATITLYAPATGTVDRATSGDGSTDILYCTSNQANQIGFNIAASVGGSTTTNYYTGFFAWTASAEL